MSAVWALQGVVPHGKKEKLTPGVEIEENPVFGFWDCFMELIVNLPVSGIKPIVPGHLEVFSGICRMSSLMKSMAGRVFLQKSCLHAYCNGKSPSPHRRNQSWKEQ